MPLIGRMDSYVQKLTAEYDEKIKKIVQKNRKFVKFTKMPTEELNLPPNYQVAIPKAPKQPFFRYYTTTNINMDGVDDPTLRFVPFINSENKYTSITNYENTLLNEEPLTKEQSVKEKFLREKIFHRFDQKLLHDLKNQFDLDSSILNDVTKSTRAKNKDFESLVSNLKLISTKLKLPVQKILDIWLSDFDQKSKSLYHDPDAFNYYFCNVCLIFECNIHECQTVRIPMKETNQNCEDDLCSLLKKKSNIKEKNCKESQKIFENNQGEDEMKDIKTEDNETKLEEDKPQDKMRISEKHPLPNEIPKENATNRSSVEKNILLDSSNTNVFINGDKLKEFTNENNKDDIVFINSQISNDIHQDIVQISEDVQISQIKDEKGILKISYDDIVETNAEEIKEFGQSEIQEISDKLTEKQEIFANEKDAKLYEIITEETVPEKEEKSTENEQKEAQNEAKEEKSVSEESETLENFNLFEFFDTPTLKTVKEIVESFRPTSCELKTLLNFFCPRPFSEKETQQNEDEKLSQEKQTNDFTYSCKLSAQILDSIYENNVLDKNAEDLFPHMKNKPKPAPTTFTKVSQNEVHLPFNHTGGCFLNRRCNCFVNKIHCRETCHCESCNLIYPGCKCSALNEKSSVKSNCDIIRESQIEQKDNQSKGKKKKNTKNKIKPTEKAKKIKTTSQLPCPCIQNFYECTDRCECIDQVETVAQTQKSGISLQKRSKNSRVTIPPSRSQKTGNLQHFKKSVIKKDCSNRAMAHFKEQPTYVSVSAIEGYGLFASFDIKNNTFVISYAGELITNAETERRGSFYEKRKLSYLFDLSKTKNVPFRIIDATKIGNKARFINHSISPNLCAKTIQVDGNIEIGFWAVKDIKKDEELFFDYCYKDEQKKHFEIKD